MGDLEGARQRVWNVSMLELSLKPDRARPLTLLCLGAHSDDLEIGCGGTILRLTSAFTSLAVHWVVFAADKEDRRGEALSGARAFLAQATEKHIVLERFRDGFFPFAGERLKECFETLRAAVEPDLVLTHCRSDLHQDHRVVSDLTWQTFRTSLILEYEVPKWDGDLGTPNCYVPIPGEVADRKVALISEIFASQRVKHWFTRDTFEALMRLRGVECGAAFAEGLYARKLVLG
jgi:LmbE family N-acetylglucosaminyl deacetylase